jgi:hypothetical protein
MAKISIDVVKQIVEANLPGCWLPLEACLSIIGAAMLADVDHCIGLILVGEPGGRKSTTLELLGSGTIKEQGYDNPIIRLHNFTPASFVSHDASKKEEHLKKIDLLPQIKYKIIVIPELAPMFGQRFEDLTKDIAILTAVMDGKGYWSHTGTHGRRGYEGDFRFNMIAATTPLEHRVWQALGRLSSRWILYRLSRPSETFIGLKNNFGQNKDTCKRFVEMFIREFWQGYGAVNWSRANDAEVWGTLLHWSASAVSQWRGLIPKQDLTGYNPAVIEVPDRLRETLYAIARGHALLWGRKQMEWPDVVFAFELNFTNMPEDRLRVFKALDDAYSAHVEAGGNSQDLFNVGISLRAASRAIGCSTDKAKYVLDELISLGVIRKGLAANLMVSIRQTDPQDDALYYRAV